MKIIVILYIINVNIIILQQIQQEQQSDNINITYPTFLPPHIIQQYILKHIDTNTEYYTTRDNLIAAHFDDIVQCKIYVVAKYYYLNLLNNAMNNINNPSSL
eukprot:UN07694